jgi:hypothetical protein
MSACAGTTRAGNPCKAPALKGTERCAAHPLSPDSPRFGSPEQASAAGKQGGRPRVPSPTEIARRLVEDNIAAVQRPYWRILGYDVVVDENGARVVEVPGGGAKLHGVSVKDGYVFMSEHDDLGAMMAAAEKLQDRSHGRPRQALEVSGPDQGPVQTALITDPTLAEDARALLRRAASSSSD